MSMTFELISSIDNDVFNSLYRQSLEAIESGGIDWQRYDHIDSSTPEARKLIVRQQFQLALLEQQVFQASIDGVVVMLATLKIEGSVGYIGFGLLGGSPNGDKLESKAWAYDTATREAAEAVFCAELGVTSFVVTTQSPEAPYSKHYEKIRDTGASRTGITHSAQPDSMDQSGAGRSLCNVEVQLKADAGES